MSKKHVRMCLLAHMELTAKDLMSRPYYLSVWSEIMDDDTRHMAIEDSSLFSLICEAYVAGLFDEYMDKSLQILRDAMK